MAEVKRVCPNRVRWHRFSVRAYIGLTGITAALFWIGIKFGYINATIIVIALLVLIRVARRPHPVHLTTAILLTLLTGILLWANLRPTGWQGEFGGVDSPMELDSITKAMFWRGWPISPCMVCLVHGMKFHPSGGEQCVLAFDGALFVVALLATKAVCERWLRWLQHRTGCARQDEFSSMR
jgi:hypothetical protein